MSSMPIPTRLFHMTACNNLESILNSGALLCKNSTSVNGIAYENIAHTTIQNRRSAKAIPIPPCGVLHDYVPFYFAPRSPMLYAINQGNVDGCDYRQDDIIYFQTTVQSLNENGSLYIFSDRNATLEYALFENDYDQLSQMINWNYITSSPSLDGYCRYFHTTPQYPERGEIRQAELLIYRQLALNHIQSIGVYNQNTLEIVNELLSRYHYNLPVSIQSAWYF